MKFRKESDMTTMKEAMRSAGIEAPEQQAFAIACDVLRRAGTNFDTARGLLSTEMSRRDAVLWWLMQPYWIEISRALLSKAAQAVKAEKRERGEANDQVPKGRLAPASPQLIGGQRKCASDGHKSFAVADGAGQFSPASDDGQPASARPSTSSKVPLSALKAVRAAEVRSVLDQACAELGKSYGDCTPEEIRPIIQSGMKRVWWLTNLINGVPDGKRLREFYSGEDADSLHRRSFGTNLHLQVMEARHGA